MCLIVDRPQGVPIPSDWLDNAMIHNPDGWGIMWAEAGAVRHVKGMGPKKFRSALDRVGDAALTIHVRFATHGAKDKDNCHPFPMVDGKYALMHNGILDCVPSHEKNRSDTYHFARYVLGPILRETPELFGTDDLADTLASMIGDNNKLVILRDDGERMIVNRKAGANVGGLWLSNTYSVADPRARRTFSGKTPVATTALSLSAGWPDDCGRSGRWEEPIGDEADLDTLANLPFEDLADLCLTDPEMVATKIHEFFYGRTY